jgi:hypothetical protein
VVIFIYVETLETKTNNRETRQIFEEKWKYNEAVYQLIIDFKKACDSDRGEILYNIMIEFFSHKTTMANKNVPDRNM